ncbi:MAG: dihydrofolate reductase family protein [Chloroflexi bacterium]|nr:dihydrofolate reductase family protein [Chloroflexota bacterium]
MAKVIFGMTMSLDGFVNDRNGSVEKLYPDLDALRKSAILQELIENTGAVVMGRNAFAMSEDPDWFAGNYEFQVPIFVLTHHPPKKMPKQTDQLTFTFVTDGIESAIRQAKAAAKAKDVTVIGGASTIRQCLQAQVGDELEVGIMPVLFGSGLRLFENIGTEEIQLEKIRVDEIPDGGTNLRFRVAR